jgi:hypothetical protein
MGVALGIVALVALGLVFSATSDAPPVDLRRPRRRHLSSKDEPLVTFHYVEVPFVTKRGTVSRKQVVETPSELRAAAEKKIGRPITGSAFVLATTIASEHGSDSPTIKAAVAQAAYNYFLAHTNEYDDVEAALTNNARTFGEQLGRHVSTMHPPSIEDLTIAEAVLSGGLPPSVAAMLASIKGATHFDSPRGQRASIKKNLAGYTQTPEQVAADRRKKFDEVHLPGVDPDYLRFWRPKKAA